MVSALTQNPFLKGQTIHKEENVKILFLLFLMFLSGCSLFPPKPDDELEKLSQDCFKAKEGIEITLTPIPIRKEK